jgi:hypothetical protein
MHADPDPDVYLFPAMQWDALAREYIVTNRKLSYPAAYTALKNLLTNCGLDAKLYALHSARIGAATNAFENNVPLHLIDAKGRWKSSNSKYSYLRVAKQSITSVGRKNQY